MDHYKGKIVVVTGASSGIGAAVTKMLLKNGMKVVGLARRKERIEQLCAKEPSLKKNLCALKVDITSEKEIVDAFKWITQNVGPLSVLVNNAGIVRPGSIINGEMKDFKSIMDTNVMGATVAAREAVSIIKKCNIVDGYIININSVAGLSVFKTPLMDMAFYQASKFALNALSKALRLELQHCGLKIRTCNVSPGFVDTEIVSHAMDAEQYKQFLEQNPSLASEDLAQAICYLLSTRPIVEITELTIKPLGENF
ncbi:farnesol dehydrogenase-like [Onthophagus taurus]|uniref:farnesol dehydrogenase-like n=1 Tax=Onthophagus taurus TaxID=166361 RepID=UPI000C202086|nr:farnesol dehydrogenase-like [Onthophagus taurus]